MTEVPRDVFAALDRAEPELLDSLGGYGIHRIEFVVGFVKPYRIHVWLGTESDAQREALTASDPLLDEVRAIVDRAGLPRREALVAGTVAQSQETVDRDYEGSWFYALR